MSHLLYKPHVIGPELNITTPDLILDRLEVHSGKIHTDNIQHVPIQRMSTHTELQTLSGALSLSPAYVVVGCGGGSGHGVALF